MFKPSKRFFELKNKEAELRKASKSRGTRIFEAKSSIKGIRDVYLAKVSSRLKSVVDEISRNGIEVYSYNLIEKEKEVKIVVEIGSVPSLKSRKVYGPSVWLNFDDLSKFLKEHRDVYVTDDKIIYDSVYPFKDANKFIYSKLKSILKPV
jgi:hypothetical protein